MNSIPEMPKFFRGGVTFWILRGGKFFRGGLRNFRAGVRVFRGGLDKNDRGEGSRVGF